jgi:hypothetical protein
MKIKFLSFYVYKEVKRRKKSAGVNEAFCIVVISAEMAIGKTTTIIIIIIIQLFLLICRLNSTSANYKAST